MAIPGIKLSPLHMCFLGSYISGFDFFDCFGVNYASNFSAEAVAIISA
jgi:hypothetical protein